MEKSNFLKKLHSISKVKYFLNFSSTLARKFLKSSKTTNLLGITKFGLQQLFQKIPKAELCILFKEDRFFIVYKNSSFLYLLVDDSDSKDCVWEILNLDEEEPIFCDENFKQYVLLIKILINFKMTFYLTLFKVHTFFLVLSRGYQLFLINWKTGKQLMLETVAKSVFVI